jgi:hypothetical protein
MNNYEVRCAFPSKTGGRTVTIGLKEASERKLGRPEVFVLCRIDGNVVHIVNRYGSLIDAARERKKYSSSK